MLEGVTSAEPDTLDVIVWDSVPVVEDVTVTDGVNDEEGVLEGV